MSLPLDGDQAPGEPADSPRRGAPEPILIAGLAADRYRAVGEPDGPALLIVHGGMDRAAGFRRTIRHLPNRDIVAYDRRGYAGSRAVPVARSITDHVDDLAAVCAELGDLDGFTELPLIVGHSIGGLVTLLALARPEADCLGIGAVVWEPPLSWNDWYVSRGEELIGIPPDEAAERFMRAVIGSKLWDRLPATMQAERRAEGPALMADMEGARRSDAIVDFAAIELPILVGCGTVSASHHQRSAHEAAAATTGARLVVIDGADHGIHLSRPTAFAELIAGWTSG